MRFEITQSSGPTATVKSIFFNNTFWVSASDVDEWMDLTSRAVGVRIKML